MHLSRLARVVAGAVFLLFAPTAPARATSPTPRLPAEALEHLARTYFGEYRNAARAGERIVIEPVGEAGVVRVRTSAGWGAVGYMDGGHFEGVMRSADMQGSPLPGPFGRLEFDVLPGGSVEATLRGRGDSGTERWDPVPGGQFGQLGPIDELPEAVRKSAPVYPEAARRAGIQGTVMVHARVSADGTVEEARVLRSVPGLDDAAIASVRRWRFKPAISGGRPVPVWVAVPVKFSLR